ncbi:MAG: DAK2 domain-containing protein [bacterium]|nr:DAK2 domain-containing protein [bacterium]
MVAIKSFYHRENLVVDGHRIKRLLGSGVLWLEKNKEKVNRLNVFPVPDGDTGTNMYLTMRHAFQRVAEMNENHVGKVSQALAEGAMIGSRGNSGVILSQIWAGVAEALKDEPTLTADGLAEACRIANEKAYKSVQEPVEGTILTVCRSMTNAVLEHHKEVQDLVALLKKMVYAGRSTLRRTPDMLPRLKEAGVVDSGGQGLVLIFEGMLFPLIGKEIAEDVVMPTDEQSWEEAIEPEDEQGYGYDVQFLMRGQSMDVDSVRTDIQNMGWSTLVVGNTDLIKVHVHVHDPGVPLSYAINLGASLDDIVVENMQAQYQQYVESRRQRETVLDAEITHVEGDVGAFPTPPIAVIAVASGRGVARVFRKAFDIGAAHVITGGQTMNPSTGDFLEAINKVKAEQIILLPNNKNILLAAQSAASQATEKQVRVVPAATIPQGLSAILEYCNLMTAGETVPSIDEVADAMTGALDYVITLEVTRAVRDTVTNGIGVREGQWIGLIDDNLTAAHDHLRELIRVLLLKGGADDRERATFYYGEGIKEAEARALVDDIAVEFDRLQYEIVNGGQPLYPYIISVE